MVPFSLPSTHPPNAPAAAARVQCTIEGWCGRTPFETCKMPAFSALDAIRPRNWALAAPLDVADMRRATIVIAYEASCAAPSACGNNYLDLALLEDSNVNFGIMNDMTLDTALLNAATVVAPALETNSMPSDPKTRNVDLASFSSLRVGLVDAQGCFYIDSIKLLVYSCPATRIGNVLLPKTFSDTEVDRLINGTCATGHMVDAAKVRHAAVALLRTRGPRPIAHLSFPFSFPSLLPSFVTPYIPPPSLSRACPFTAACHQAVGTQRPTAEAVSPTVPCLRTAAVAAARRWPLARPWEALSAWR